MSTPFDNVFATSSRKKSAIVFWFAALAVACIWSYSEQKAFRDQCIITNGTVTGKVLLRVRHSDQWCAQISYFAGGEEQFFADKTHGSLRFGDKVKVIYQKNKINNAYVYGFGFWINYRVIILTLLIAFVLFGLIWGLTQKFPEGTEVLPSSRVL